MKERSEFSRLKVSRRVKRRIKSALSVALVTAMVCTSTPYWPEGLFMNAVH